jgi:hypothetical protein
VTSVNVQFLVFWSFEHYGGLFFVVDIISKIIIDLVLNSLLKISETTLGEHFINISFFFYLIVNISCIDCDCLLPIEIVIKLGNQRFLILFQALEKHDNFIFATAWWRKQVGRFQDEQRRLARRIADYVGHGWLEYVILIANYLARLERISQVDLKTKSNL